MTLFDLVHETIPETKIYKTNIDFIDNTIGGIELGRLYSITGEEDSGKTKLLNQINIGLAKENSFLYIGLEFNKRQIHEDFKEKYKNKLITKTALMNTQILTSDVIEPNIENIKKAIEKSSALFIGIDSAMMIHIDGMQDEKEQSGIYQELHFLCSRLDKTIFIIGQSSKMDLRARRVSIFNSQLANHLVDVKFHIFYDLKKNKREFCIAKNKQNGWKGEVEVFFDTKTFLFKSLNAKSVKNRSVKKNNNSKRDNTDIIIEEEKEDLLSDKEMQYVEKLKNSGINFYE